MHPFACERDLVVASCSIFGTFSGGTNKKVFMHKMKNVLNCLSFFNGKNIVSKIVASAKWENIKMLFIL